MLFRKYRDAATELCVRATRRISSCNRFVLVALDSKKSNRSTNVVFVHALLLQKYFFCASRSFTFLPCMGKSFSVRFLRECICPEGSPQYGQFAISRFELTRMINSSPCISCPLYCRLSSRSLSNSSIANITQELFYHTLATSSTIVGKSLFNAYISTSVSPYFRVYTKYEIYPSEQGPCFHHGCFRARFKTKLRIQVMCIICVE